MHKSTDNDSKRDYQLTSAEQTELSNALRRLLVNNDLGHANNFYLLAHTDLIDSSLAAMRLLYLNDNENAIMSAMCQKTNATQLCEQFGYDNVISLLEYLDGSPVTFIFHTYTCSDGAYYVNADCPFKLGGREQMTWGKPGRQAAYMTPLH